MVAIYIFPDECNCIDRYGHYINTYSEEMQYKLHRHGRYGYSKETACFEELNGVCYVAGINSLNQYNDAANDCN